MTTAAEASMINPVALFMEADIVVQAIMIGLAIDDTRMLVVGWIDVVVS